MASYEKQNVRGNSYWEARLIRERQNISESVEQTLADMSSLEEWSNEQQHYDPTNHSSTGTELVPPQISLQSKVLPSVRPVSFVQSVTAEIAAQKAAAKEVEEQQKPQSTNILARFAQRFTSSIAAIMQPDTYTWEPTASKQSETPQERHLTPLPPTHTTVSVEREQESTVIDAIPATPSQPLLPPVQSKQRLAGHTAKIRLQNAPTAKATPHLKEEGDVYAWNRETKEPLREPLTVNVRVREVVRDRVSVSSSIPMSVSEKFRSQQEKRVDESTGCTTFFGKGSFEKGQGELMVRDVHTIETSVVHVTLTSNPGPTLVQYISLHPEVGFTLHLTAPAEAKTTFNYVLFVDASVSL